jgi:hypothetical protein
MYFYRLQTQGIPFEIAILTVKHIQAEVAAFGRVSVRSISQALS